MSAFGGLAQHSFDQVSELIGSELVPFNIRYEFALPIDDNGVQRMVHQAFVGEEIHAEQVGHLPND
jgi:hypothetical protein